MSREEICPSMVTGEPSSSSETQDENLPKIWIKLKGILTQDKKDPIIHKVPHLLRQVNEKAYEPYVISIGPYHHGNPNLKKMEDFKKSFFITTVGESKENLQPNEIEKIKAIKDLETAIRDDLERIKECYADPLNVKFDSEEEFVDMVLLDGFLIVQLFMGKSPPELEQGAIFDIIGYDLLLLENQLPFFVLVKMHQIITQNEETEENFIRRILHFFQIFKISKCPIRNINHLLHLLSEKKHLLHLIHGTWSPSDQNQPQSQSQSQSQPQPQPQPESQPESQPQPQTESQPQSQSNSKRSCGMPCARDLEEAGISFESRNEEEEICRAWDIEFKGNCRKPKLRIPKLSVNDDTERMLRNLIAFEQFFPYGEPTYVFDYVHFLDNLINSGQDVQLLCNSGIIENSLGDYEAVAKVFNRLGDHSCAPGESYFGIFKQVNDHCNNRLNKQMANLRRNYFNSPWALLSFLAALILLFLTFAQTLLALREAKCHSCEVLFIAFGVLLVAIGLLIYLCFS